MKISLLAPLLVFSLSVLFFSCSKSSSNAPSNPIVGYWVGTLEVDQQPEVGKLYYTFDIRSDSTILTTSQTTDGGISYNQGTWTLSGSDFKATTIATSPPNTGAVEHLTATYNSSNGTLSSGVWNGPGGPLSGTFSLNRVN